MAWVRAVWKENGEEMEEVMPSTWVQGKEVVWPRSANSSRLIKERTIPGTSWFRFPLTKIKYSSDDFMACLEHNLTSDDVEGNPQMRSRSSTRTENFVYESDASDDHDDPSDQDDLNGENITMPTMRRKKRKHTECSASDTVEEILDDLPVPPEHPLYPKRKPNSHAVTAQNLATVGTHASTNPETPSRTLTSPIWTHTQTETSWAPTQTGTEPTWTTIQTDTPQTWTTTDTGIAHTSAHNVMAQTRTPTPTGTPQTLTPTGTPPTRTLTPTPQALTQTHTATPQHRTPTHTSTPQASTRPQTPTDSQQPEAYPMTTARFQKKVINLLVQIRNSLNSIPHLREENVTEGRFVEQCETLDDVDSLEERLADRSARRNLVQQLARVGGPKVSKNVINVLNRVMSNEVMARFNLKGNKGKRAFQDLQLYKVVRDSVLACQREATEEEINMAISCHLKYAQDRRGGGGRQ